jgi:hypothetical protein
MSAPRRAFLEFSEINETVEIEFVSSHSSLTVMAILRRLLLKIVIER